MWNNFEGFFWVPFSNNDNKSEFRKKKHTVDYIAADPSVCVSPIQLFVNRGCEQLTPFLRPDGRTSCLEKTNF